MLKIRLMRIGTKQRPFYRVVVIDERSKRNGAYIELLGTYNPLTEPKDIKLKQDRIDHWIKTGAQMSDGFLRIIGKAPQRPPRKAKKEKKESSVINPQTSEKTEGTPASKEESKTEGPTEEPKVEEVKTEEVPVEEQQTEETQNQPVIASEQSEAKQSSSEENPIQIATEPSAPRNDEEKKEEKSNERPA